MSNPLSNFPPQAGERANESLREIHFNHIVCPHCDAVNRVPEDKLGAAPTCGKCKQALFTAHPVSASNRRDTTILASLGDA